MQKNNPDVWQFPCDFPIKVVGKASVEFELFVLTVARKHFPDLAENAIEQRPSKDNKYLAITLQVHATSKEQLDQAYLELSANELVLMTL